MAKTMTWDANADRQLLLSILAIQKITVDFDAVAESFGCTARAVQERLKRLKKMAEIPVSSTPVTPSKSGKKKPSNKEATPVSKKRKATGTPKNSAKKGKKNAMVEVYDDEDDGDTKIKEEHIAPNEQDSGFEDDNGTKSACEDHSDASENEFDGNELRETAKSKSEVPVTDEEILGEDQEDA